MTKQNLKQSGNIMLITTIVILVLTVIIATCINISSMQLDLSILERNTSNTYYLAKSGVEKQVDAINKSLDVEMSYIVQELSKEYIKKLAEPQESNIEQTKAKKLEAMEADAGCQKYDEFYYENNKLRITSSNLGEGAYTGIQSDLQKKIHSFVVKNFINKPSLVYEVQSDRVDNANYKTVVTIKSRLLFKDDGVTTDQTGFKLIATAETKNISDYTVYDTQTVEATVELHMPDDLPNEIHERYTWAAQPPELLNSALVSFSDVVVTSGGSLQVEKGDIQVKGGIKQATYKIDASNKIQTTAGGFADATETGGIIASNGGKIEVKHGDIACINNVMTTNGWSADVDDTRSYGNYTNICVSNGDIIANTVGIVDDYYEGGSNQSPFNADKQGTNLSIYVGHNTFTSNDVMISRWIRNSGIEIKGAIFGINDGSDPTTKCGGDILTTNGGYFLDPNSSSGVFSQGEYTTISAYRIFVNGQPYVALTKDALPMKLWESVGEPFDGVSLWEGYRTGDESNVKNRDYLNNDSPFISLVQKNKIKIIDTNVHEHSYAPASISANNQTVTATGIDASIANKLFMKGFLESDLTHAGNKLKLSDYTNEGNYMDSEYITEQTKNQAIYYKNSGKDGKGRDYDWYNQALMYGKTYTTTSADLENYMGLRAYMTAKRSVFYGKLDNKNLPQLLKFSEVVGDLPHTEHSWSYGTPIRIIHSGDASISLKEFYIDQDGEGPQVAIPYPTILINAGDGVLTLKQEGGYTDFKGVIISQGDVRINGNIHIEGSLIIRGSHESANPQDRKMRMNGKNEDSLYSPGLMIGGSGNKLTLISNPDILLRLQVGDEVLFRQILDALKITQYEGNTDVKKILGPYASGNLVYSAGKVFYTTASTLEVQTQNVKVQIKNLKKMR